MQNYSPKQPVRVEFHAANSDGTTLPLATAVMLHQHVPAVDEMVSFSEVATLVSQPCDDHKHVYPLDTIELKINTPVLIRTRVIAAMHHDVRDVLMLILDFQELIEYVRIEFRAPSSTSGAAMLAFATVPKRIVPKVGDQISLIQDRNIVLRRAVDDQMFYFNALDEVVLVTLPFKRIMKVVYKPTSVMLLLDHTVAKPKPQPHKKKISNKMQKDIDALRGFIDNTGIQIRSPLNLTSDIPPIDDKLLDELREASLRGIGGLATVESVPDTAFAESIIAGTRLEPS